MKRLVSGVVMGAFLFSNALAFNAAALDETSISGTAFHGLSSQTGLNHFGNGIHNGSGAAKGVTGTMTLRLPTPVNVNVEVWVFFPAGTLASSCTVWETSSNGASQTSFAMTPSAIAGGTRFFRNSINFNSNTQTLAVHCDLANNATLAMMRVLH